jgi:glycosyltransferase involved in cell wall biosynthesis
MRVLWLCNIMLPLVGKHLNKTFSNFGGWLDGLSSDLLNDMNTEVELAVAFPMSPQDEPIKGKVKIEESGNTLFYYGFPRISKNESIYDVRLEKYLADIVEEYNPDLVHIFGTEFAHTLAMTRVLQDMERIIINMQGVMRACAKKYDANLPEYIIRRYTLRDCLRRDNVRDARTKFILRAGFEIEALNNVKHVVGRTDFDRLETKKINENRVYHKINETLRTPFYGEVWDINKAKKHSILFSQGNYPLKGLHFMLEALPEIKKKFPDVKLYIAGDRIVPDETMKSRLKVSSYGKYLHGLIRKYGIRDHVVFLGSLNAEEMIQAYLDNRVFVSSSVIENSPNSVAEAMLLGMPVVSSNVGGVPSMIDNQVEGLLTKEADIDELVDAVVRIFTDDDLAEKLGKQARKRALMTHNREKNYQDLMELYHEIGNRKNET